MAVGQDKIQSDYRNRVDKVFLYIDQNLGSKLSLEEISEIALFSPFHFHRIFKTITHETLNEYVTRRRIEKSALDLIHTRDSLTEIFLRYGFNDSSSYSRAFKKFYGISPTDFRKEKSSTSRKIGTQKSKNGQFDHDYKKYICAIDNLKKWIQMNSEIEIKETAEMSLAAVTHIGINGIEHAFERLLRWANSKHLMNNPEDKVGRLFYDSFKVTAADKVRMVVFLATNEPFEPEGEIQKITIKQGKCIVARFEIAPVEFENAWSGLFIWMNENGYKKSQENPFEIYHNDFREHPENKFIVDLYIPIE